MKTFFRNLEYIAGCAIAWIAYPLAGVGWLIYRVLRLPADLCDKILAASDRDIKRRFPVIEPSEKSPN